MTAAREAMADAPPPSTRSSASEARANATKIARHAFAVLTKPELSRSDDFRRGGLSRFLTIANHVREISSLTSTEKLVLYSIATRLGPSGSAWPSLRRIALDASLSPRSVTKSIRALERSGLLTTTRRSSSNLYRINVEAIVAAAQVSASPQDADTIADDDARGR